MMPRRPNSPATCRISSNSVAEKVHPPKVSGTKLDWLTSSLDGSQDRLVELFTEVQQELQGQSLRLRQYAAGEAKATRCSISTERRRCKVRVPKTTLSLRGSVIIPSA